MVTFWINYNIAQHKARKLILVQYVRTVLCYFITHTFCLTTYQNQDAEVFHFSKSLPCTTNL